ncbi:MAG: UpxY family transcription antiterminator [Bacteroidaceae bacterium]|nr:UpxY family transcription antiterminator [Bacteroidaceae bacterium]
MFVNNVADDTLEKSWFVMRVTYQRELKAKEILDKLGIESFVPTKRVRKTTKEGFKIWSTESVIHNYIFINTYKEKLNELKRYEIPWLRYVMKNRSEAQKQPLIVPERQMQSFIAIAGNEKEKIMYLDSEEVDLTCGDKVRILSGPFEGAEGTFMKVQNRGGKRVVVKIEGIIAVATTTLPGSFVEKIEN